MSGAAAILLAAGLSSRMGRSKPLLDWCGEPLVAYQVRQLQRGGAAAIVVVTGDEAGAVEAALDGFPVIVARNESFREGRASSLRTGALALSESPDAIVLLNVDQPRHAEVIAGLIAAHARLGGLITQPSYHGRRGHPIVIAGTLLPELTAVTDADEGLRAVVHRHVGARRELPVEAAEVLLDLNDPEAYHAALRDWRP